MEVPTGFPDPNTTANSRFLIRHDQVRQRTARSCSCCRGKPGVHRDLGQADMARYRDLAPFHARLQNATIQPFCVTGRGQGSRAEDERVRGHSLTRRRQ